MSQYFEQLANIKSQFTGIISNIVNSYVNYQLYPDDTSYSNTYNNYKNAILKCNADLVKLDLEVENAIGMSHNMINKILETIYKSKNSILSKMLPNLFQQKLTSKNMKDMNISLFTYQLLLNWELFLGVIFLFFIIVLYYRKYYTTKEVIDYASKKFNDTKESISDNIETVKKQINQPKKEKEEEEKE